MIAIVLKLTVTTPELMSLWLLLWIVLVYEADAETKECDGNCQCDNADNGPLGVTCTLEYVRDLLNELLNVLCILLS